MDSCERTDLCLGEPPGLSCPPGRAIYELLPDSGQGLDLRRGQEHPAILLT